MGPCKFSCPNLWKILLKFIPIIRYLNTTFFNLLSWSMMQHNFKVDGTKNDVCSRPHFVFNHLQIILKSCWQHFFIRLESFGTFTQMSRVFELSWHTFWLNERFCNSCTLQEKLLRFFCVSLIKIPGFRNFLQASRRSQIYR